MDVSRRHPASRERTVRFRLGCLAFGVAVAAGVALPPTPPALSLAGQRAMAVVLPGVWPGVEERHLLGEAALAVDEVQSA